MFTAFALSWIALLSPALLAQDEDTQQHYAAIRAWMAQSMEQLRQYEWIETTVINSKGEEKSRKEERCYYGSDGVFQKEPVVVSSEPKKKLTETMQEAVGLVKSYFPLSGETMRQCKGMGRMSVIPLTGGSVLLTFRGYYKDDDVLAVTLDTATHRLVTIRVESYLGKRKNAVTLDVTISALPDGTGYASQIVLVDNSEELNISVTNTGFRKTGG
jgi:hypothetical protein